MNQQSGRIQSVDALRGFALTGILVVNIQVFSGWGFIGPEGREALSWSGYDTELLAGLKVLAHDKFYSLFSLLFGYSFVILVQKRGAGAGSYHLRRMLGLLLFGVAHAVLLWPWDILLLYALVGILLTPFLGCRPVTLSLWAVFLLLLTGVGRWYWLVHDPGTNWSTLARDILADSVPVLSSGSYLEVMAANLRLLLANTIERLADLRPLRVMAMFLLGAAGARLRLAEADGGSRSKWLALCSLLVLPLALLLAIAEQRLSPGAGSDRLFFVITETLAGPLTAIGYGAILLLWWNRGGPLGRRVSALFAPAGRMALTNYLGQSLVCVPVFYGFGLNLFAEWSLAKLLLFCAALLLAQLLASRLWLEYFRQGPMEWLWRWQMQGSRPRLLRRGD